MIMARTKDIIAGDTTVRPMSDERSWARANGTYISGRAYLDGADETAAEMEAKWGADRLRLLVSPELREKFDRQRYLLNQAIWHGDLEQVRHEANRMTTAWLALDKAATAAGKQPLHPQVWEVAVTDPGMPDDPTNAAYVVAIVPDDASARHVIADGRKVTVYTLDEIGRILAAYPDLAKVKDTFPGGATITAVRRSVDDPLDAIHDTKAGLDDPVEDIYA
jgi:hypothetical protein